MNLNKEALEKPTKNGFVSAMTKAIKNAKEAYRRKRVVNPRRRPAENVLEEEQPLRQRPRVLLPVNDDAPIVEAVQNEDIPPVRNNSNAQDNGEQEYDDDLQGSQNIEEDNDNPILTRSITTTTTATRVTARHNRLGNSLSTRTTYYSRKHCTHQQLIVVPVILAINEHR